MTELLVLFVMMVIIAFITGSATVKSRKSEERYDERQLIARGKAAEAGFYTLMLTLVSFIFYTEFVSNPMLTSSIGIGLCVIVSVAVFAIVGIVKDAYIERNSSTKSKIMLFSIIGTINLALAAISIAEDGMIEYEVVRFNVLSLAVGLLMVAVVIALAVRNAKQKKEAALEESDDE